MTERKLWHHRNTEEHGDVTYISVRELLTKYKDVLNDSEVDIVLTIAPYGDYTGCEEGDEPHPSFELSTFEVKAETAAQAEERERHHQERMSKRLERQKNKAAHVI